MVCGLVMAATMLWLLVPRRSQFDVPGPQLEAERAGAPVRGAGEPGQGLGEPMPREVYLIPEVHAFVAERGGNMFGFRRRRYAGRSVCLPDAATMVRTLTIWRSPALRAMGRMVIARLVQVLAIGGMNAYWTLFLRATQMVSRRRESRADELACRLAGSRAMIDGLCAIQKASAAIQSYWQSALAPARQGGYRPPIAEGFGMLVAAPWVARGFRAHGERAAEEGHQPLRYASSAARADYGGRGAAIAGGGGRQQRGDYADRGSGRPGAATAGAETAANEAVVLKLPDARSEGDAADARPAHGAGRRAAIDGAGTGTAGPGVEAGCAARAVVPGEGWRLREDRGGCGADAVGEVERGGVAGAVYGVGELGLSERPRRQTAP